MAILRSVHHDFRTGPGPDLASASIQGHVSNLRQPGVNALVPAHKLPDSWLEANFVCKSVAPKATSLRDQDRVDQWPAALLPYQPVEAVCHLRWGVETPNDILKNGWELKNFSGIRPEVFAQEHQATVVTRNMAAPVEHEAQT